MQTSQDSLGKLSASIVLYKTPENQLRKVVDSVLQSGLTIDLHLIDNSPSPCIEPSDFAATHYIFTGRNLGYGAGHNIAIRKILYKSTYHFVLNPDISFDPAVIPSITRFMDSDPTIGHVMPQVRYPDGNIQYLCKLIPSPIDLLVRKIVPDPFKAIFKNRMNWFELRHTGYQMIMDVPFLSGCFMALRVEALQHTGLFDERFFMYAEDIDLTRRLAENYRTTFFPEVSIIHDHARESYHSLRMLLIHSLNIMRYFNKWGWIWDTKRNQINTRILDQFEKTPR